jgi:hypothetical protein
LSPSPPLSPPSATHTSLRDCSSSVGQRRPLWYRKVRTPLYTPGITRLAPRSDRLRKRFRAPASETEGSTGQHGLRGRRCDECERGACTVERGRAVVKALSWCEWRCGVLFIPPEGVRRRCNPHTSARCNQHTPPHPRVSGGLVRRREALRARAVSRGGSGELTLGVERGKACTHTCRCVASPFHVGPRA